MKGKIAALIAGLVLGTAGTAAATTATGYWTKSGSGYKCEGIASGVTCDSGGYQVGITPSFVYVQRKGSKETFGCRKWSRFSGCVSD